MGRLSRRGEGGGYLEVYSKGDVDDGCLNIMMNGQNSEANQKSIMMFLIIVGTKDKHDLLSMLAWSISTSNSDIAIFRHARVSSTYPCLSVRPSVRPSVLPSVTLSDFQPASVSGRPT